MRQDELLLALGELVSKEISVGELLERIVDVMANIAQAAPRNVVRAGSPRERIGQRRGPPPRNGGDPRSALARCRLASREDRRDRQSAFREW